MIVTVDAVGVQMVVAKSRQLTRRWQTRAHDTLKFPKAIVQAKLQGDYGNGP